jgi:hypothetical protein
LISQEKNEIMQKQLEALSFLDKRKATKPKLVANQVPSVSDVTQGSDQVIVPAQQQTPGNHASPCSTETNNSVFSQLMKLQTCSSFTYQSSSS